MQSEENEKYYEEFKKEITELDKDQCLVAFLDILGFKNHVDKYINPISSQEEKVLENIKSGLEYSVETIKNVDQDLNLIKYKIFSDCTCISIPAFRNTHFEAAMFCLLIETIRRYIVYLITWKIYLRGGVSVGFHYEDDNVIFSEGLIKSHDLESEKAIYPRTILDDELVQRLKKLWINQKEIILMFGTEKKIIVDDKGIAFINPFNIGHSLIPDNLEKINQIFDNEQDFKAFLQTSDDNIHRGVLREVEEKIKEFEGDEHIVEKYMWLKDLINWNINPESSKNKFEYLLKSE